MYYTVQISLQVFSALQRRHSAKSWCFLMCFCSRYGFFAVQVFLLAAYIVNLPLWLFWLVSLKFRQKIGNFWKNSDVFWKWTPESSQITPAWCRGSSTFALADLLFSRIWLAEDKLYNFFLNLDTCLVAIVNVSNETSQLVINWAIRLI